MLLPGFPLSRKRKEPENEVGTVSPTVLVGLGFFQV